MFIPIEIENDYGIDSLDIVIKLWPLINAEEHTKIEKELNKFKSFLVSQIKRGITKDEETTLLGCLQKIMKTLICGWQNQKD